MNKAVAFKTPVFFVKALHFLGIRKTAVPRELQDAINSCNSEDELIKLLFSSGTLDEAAINAFDKRFDELEKSA